MPYKSGIFNTGPRGVNTWTFRVGNSVIAIKHYIICNNNIIIRGNHLRSLIWMVYAFNIPKRMQNNYDDDTLYALITIILFNNSTRPFNSAHIA